MENLQTHTVVALVTKSIILTLSLDNLSPSDRL